MCLPDRSVLRAFVRGIALTLTLIIAGGGCTGDNPAVVDVFDPDGMNDRSIVVAIGDSITFGILDTHVETCGDSDRGAGGFCPVLQSLTGKIVINEGLCGEESAHGLGRFTSVLQRWRPSVILIDYSPNDLPNGTMATISNLRAMIDAARMNNTVPILGTLLPAVGDHRGWNDFILSLNAEIRALCAEQELECADHYTAFKNDPRFIASPYSLLSPDGLHPNHEGYALMAETWRWPLLRMY